MVRAWFMDDDSEADKRKPHMKDPENAMVSLDELAKLGVLYFHIDGGNWDENPILKGIRKKRGYNYQDAITCSKECMPDLEDKLVAFYKEHLHADEEIRLITEGSGYFDVRDTQDRWIRIEVVKEDMIILPAGIYHRFTLDEKNYVEAKRYFTGVPVWTPINRPAEEHGSRQNYLKSFAAEA